MHNHLKVIYSNEKHITDEGKGNKLNECKIISFIISDFVRFAFFVRDRVSDSIIFSGRVQNPNIKSSTTVVS